MPKKKLNTLVQSARKTLRNDIRLNLVKELKETITQLGQNADVIEKDINRGSKKLAKKLAKKIKIDEAALAKSANEAKPADTAAAPAPKPAKAGKAKAVK